MQIGALKAAGVPEGVVLMDAGYGVDTALREAIAALGLDYIAGVQSHMTVWPAGEGPLPPAPWSGRGRPPSRRRRDAGHRPIAIKALASRREGAAGGSPRASPGCGCGPRIAMRGSRRPGRRNGC